MGVAGGVGPFLAVDFLKGKLGYDDALDTFGVHGVGGTLGAILTGVFASEKANPNLAGHLDGLLLEQLKACGVTIVWSLAATFVIAMIVKFAIGLRPSAEHEELGLDLVEHGEQGYES
jgi:Amt family ammonium transporter